MTEVVLMVGTRKGAFFLESDDDRTDWSVRGPKLKGWEVSDLLYDDRDTPRLFAAMGHFVYGPAIHRSDDFGDTWEQVAQSPAYAEDSDFELNQVWCLEPGREQDPDVLYAGVDEAGLFVSRDGGDTWDHVEGLAGHETRDRWYPGNGGLCCHSVLTDPEDPDRLWVGISAVGVFRTDDGGESWTLATDGLEFVTDEDDHGGVGSCVHSLAQDPSDPERIVQQNHMGVFRTTDGGDQWEAIGDALPSSFGFPIEMHPTDPDTFFTFPLESDEYRIAEGGEPAIYRTTDGGDSWDRCADGLPTDSWVTVLRQSMAVDSLDPAGIYVGTTGGSIFYSRDGGDSWAEIDCHLPRITSVSAVVVE
ncbi:WD40/YVTN/BNR-like repeat-containing protein [Haloarchaeobius sp. DFWS5]|uniref:WD40/YVTN/BNR-like repeat-containing protein n=1 Tax=Haloarchaeobius sp. DFWS5 TaxID=3446114 RepID=UPI003EC01298